MAKTVTRRMAKLALRKYVGEMVERWEVPCEVRFHNGGGSAAYNPGGQKGGLIRFGVGLEGALYWARWGWRESHRRAQHLVKGHRKGKRALVYLAAHEYAHVMTDYLHPHADAHGREWRLIYKLLLKAHLPGYDRSRNGKA